VVGYDKPVLSFYDVGRVSPLPLLLFPVPEADPALVAGGRRLPAHMFHNYCTTEMEFLGHQFNK
jgi:hypothetical protein